MVVTSSLALLLATALSSYAAAIPASTLTTGKQFSISAVHNDKFVRNGTAAMLKAYAKYNLKPTTAGTVLGRRQDGVVTASPDSNDVEYLCPVDIGGETLNLDFDTGSADLWVFSTSLPSSDCQSHTCYDPSQSSSFQNQDGSSWSISYGDGSSSSGTVGTDTVSIGGTTVQGQVVELATTVSSSFVSGQADGLVGLAFSNINTVQPQQADTFFANAASSLDAPILGAYLPYQSSGSYDFGYTDSSKFSGSIVYTDVDSSGGFWQFDSTSYKVGGQTFTSSGTVGIADTGTTLVLMSDAAVTNYYAQVSGAAFDNSQGGYTFPCSASLPDLSFLVGPDNYATVPGSLINFGPASGSNCFGGLQSAGSSNMNIYGDVFFNANYAVFDTSVPQFGFAPST